MAVSQRPVFGKKKTHLHLALVHISLATINSPSPRPSALSDIGHPPTTSSLAGQHPPSVPTQVVVVSEPLDSASPGRSIGGFFVLFFCSKTYRGSSGLEFLAGFLPPSLPTIDCVADTV